MIGFIFAPLIARTVRSAVQVESQLDYLAPPGCWATAARIMFGEILPNVMPTVLVEFTVRLGYAIFAVATLAFLGFGVDTSDAQTGGQILQQLRRDQRPATGGRPCSPRSRSLP